MIDKAVQKKYKLTVGVECHVQLSTKTKLFAAVGNDARDADPNTLISHICLGMPGALPVLNEQAVEYAMRVAFAFNTKPQKYSYFERKHYFYPDLPKGYQITQLDGPIIKGGHVDVKTDEKNFRVKLNRVQIEEDAGKTSHPAGKDYSLVDLNRAGTPLLEVVSEPDIHSAAEARAYARELWLIMRYTGVSDADLYHGNMRFDVNVSVSKTEELGLRTETKNLNSFKSVEKAVDYEMQRQIELLEKGQPIVQETRGWDDAKQKTFSQRSKEDAHDYRYFPDPDIPPVELSDTAINEVKKHMPMLPSEIRSKLATLELDSSAIETLLDEIPAGKIIIDLLENGVKKPLIKRIANWLIVDLQGQIASGEKSWTDLNLDQDNLVALAEMAHGNKLSSTAAKSVLFETVDSGDSPAIIAEAKNLLQVSDLGAIEEIVNQVLAENSQAAEDVKNGEMKAIGFLVGQVMKASKGKANPAMAQQAIKKQLGL